MKGRRIYPDMANGGELRFSEGDYGRTLTGKWLVRPPNSHLGSLEDHEVVEHEDGTISVSPSIDGPGFHGYLEKGIWRSC